MTKNFLRLSFDLPNISLKRKNIPVNTKKNDPKIVI